jgi:hypothetical protein
MMPVEALTETRMRVSERLAYEKTGAEQLFGPGRSDRTLLVSVADAR